MTPKERDCSLHLFNTTSDSPDAQTMFRTALDTGDLYRIGIATHCYSDTWAHQNFVGFKHSFGDLKGLIPWILPSIGHADFQHQPDIPNLKWTDPRLLKKNSTVTNRKRFLLAARSIFTAFAKRNGLDDIDIRWANLAEQLGRAIGDDCSGVKHCLRGQAQRIAAYREICPEMPDYNEKSWLEATADPVVSRFQRFGDRFWRWASTWSKVGPFAKAYWPKRFRVRRFRANNGFQQSHWFRFQEAVKNHQSYVMNSLKDRYDQIQVAVGDLL